MASLAANSPDCKRLFLKGTKYLNGIKGFKWHMPFTPFLCHLNIPCHLKNAGIFKWHGRFKWHVPCKSFTSLKKTCTFLNDLNDLNDLNGKPRGGLPRVSAVIFLKRHKIFKWHKWFKWQVPFKSFKSFKYFRTFLKLHKWFKWHVPFKSFKPFKNHAHFF